MASRRASLSLLFTVVLVACGAPSSAPTSPPLPFLPEEPLPGTPRDAGAPLHPPRGVAVPVAEPCPRSLVESVSHPATTCRTPDRTCSYEAPAGSCICQAAARPQCGGVEVPRSTTLTWRCSLAQPESVKREDGCPLVPPVNGATCTGTRTCTWPNQGSCARDQASATCISGRWKSEMHFGLVPP